MSKLGDAETKKLTSTRFFLKKKNETNWRDFGNCLTHKPNWEVQRADHMKSDGGFKRMDVSLVKSIMPKYEFELDEHTPQLEELLMLGTQGADVVQAGGAVVAEELTDDSKKGRVYFTANSGLTLVVVKVGATTYTLDTDYALDAGSGAITILPDSTIPDGSTVTADYTAAAVTTQPFTSFTEFRLEGDCKIIEKDQFSDIPREVTTFFGSVYITNWGENNLEDYNKTTLVAIPLTNPAKSTRKD